jgi:predicted nucleotidyltransferase
MYDKVIKLSGLSVGQTSEIVPKNTILLGYVGSISHGTYVPKADPNHIDDKDIMGMCVLPKSGYLGTGQFPSLKGKKWSNEQQEVMKDEWDCVVYEARKYIKLLLKQNPNVMSLLWLQEKDYIHIGTQGKKLIDNRDIFSSKEAYHSFAGYANGQLHRMEHQAFEGYMGAKRKELVKKHGYDTKNAAHLIRLLRMGIEYLTDGELRVYRVDNHELKDIKQGKWTLEKIKREADDLFTLAREAYVRSILPALPDYDKAEALLIEIIEETLYGGNNER